MNEFCILIYKTFLFSGTSLPNVACTAGYFCRRNATSGTPNQGIDANICPVGHYCPKGTGEPFNCPLGTFGNDTGMYVLLCTGFTCVTSECYGCKSALPMGPKLHGRILQCYG